MQSKSTLALLLLILFSAGSALAQPDGEPSLSAQIYASQTAVRPGERVEIAVELVFTKGWHIYHPIKLETGAPTEIDLTLPEGVTASPWRFPEPYLGEQAGIEYLGLKSPVYVLTTLHVPQDFPGDSLEVRASAFALACKELCVPVEGEAQLTLPVTTDAVAPANGQVFEKARRALPAPLAEADFISGSRMAISHERIPVGGKATIAAVINVKPNHHIQDRDPGVKDFIPTRLWIEEIPGIEVNEEDQIWPKPHIENVEGVGRIREQKGEFGIFAPLHINDEKFAPRSVRLRALLQYQACDDEGGCFPPEIAEGWVTFEVVPAGEAPVASNAAILEKLPAQQAASESAVEAPAGAAAKNAAPVSEPNLLLVFLGAFVGGAILNIMPCVLPVISLKILGFVQQAGGDRGRTFRMGLVYAAGIMASFAVLAVLMVSAGLAWGGLMQSPSFLVGMSAVVFAFALSLLGVYEIQLPGMAQSAAGELASREGYAGAFFNGILATLLATPCVAPFLGSAIGILTRLPPAVGASGILVAGLGLATPYVLLTAFPGWLRFLPRPGNWMVIFKHITGFILLAVVLWLLWILSAMVAKDTLLAILGLLLMIGVGCWILGKVRLSDSLARVAGKWALALLIVGFGGAGSFYLFAARDSKIPWQPWQPGIAEQLAADGYTVYVDYTAEWCLTCKSNKYFVLDTDKMAREFASRNVYPIMADFTNYNPEIQEELRKHGRAGVPLNIVLPAGKPDSPIVLPEVLTPGIVMGALKDAGPSEKKPELRRKGEATIAAATTKR